jgi:predicted nucleic acid-binding protein
MLTNDPAPRLPRLVAVCDACALYSITMADLLTSLGEAGLYQPRWTAGIHEEWIRNVIDNRGPSGTLTREKLEARRDAMIEAIENSLVEEYEDLIPTLTLPDADDRHVLAAAIKAEADLIVTINLKDFPSTTLAAWNLAAIHPDDFTTGLLGTDQEAVVAVVKETRERRKRPPIHAEEFLAQLERQGLKKFVAELRRIGAEI